MTFANENDYDLILEDDVLNLKDLDQFSPGENITLEVIHSDGSSNSIVCHHSYNAGQIEWFREGSALNLIKKESN